MFLPNFLVDLGKLELMFWGIPIPKAEMGQIGFEFYQRDTNRFKRASNSVLGPHHPHLQKMLFAHNGLDWRIWGHPDEPA